QLGANMVVPMGSISNNVFTGVGSKGPETEFEISLLGCDTTVSSAAAFTFRPGAGSIVDGRLLSLENGAGAQGVAVGLADSAGPPLPVYSQRHIGRPWCRPCDCHHEKSHRTSTAGFRRDHRNGRRCRASCHSAFEHPRNHE